MEKNESGRLTSNHTNRKTCETCRGTKTKRRIDGTEGVEDCTDCDGDGTVPIPAIELYEAR